jgi:hypothetical protein
MNPELQKYYESRLEMVASPAWCDLMDDVQNMLKATDTLSGITLENLQYKQGEISIMKWLLSLKETSNEVYEQLKEDDANS